jgi:hypothetical protein
MSLWQNHGDRKKKAKVGEWGKRSEVSGKRSEVRCGGGTLSDESIYKSGFFILRVSRVSWLIKVVDGF